jgi:hypothetical protein
MQVLSRGFTVLKRSGLILLISFPWIFIYSIICSLQPWFTICPFRACLCSGAIMWCLAKQILTRVDYKLKSNINLFQNWQFDLFVLDPWRHLLISQTSQLTSWTRNMGPSWSMQRSIRRNMNFNFSSARCQSRKFDFCVFPSEWSNVQSSSKHAPLRSDRLILFRQLSRFSQ